MLIIEQVTVEGRYDNSRSFDQYISDIKEIPATIDGYNITVDDIEKFPKFKITYTPEYHTSKIYNGI